MAIMKLFTSLVEKEKGEKMDSDFARDAKPGDIVLWRGKRSDILYAGIQMFTYSPYNHASVYDSDGWTIGAGAWGTGYEGMSKDEGLDLFRVVNYTDELGQAILSGAKSKIGHAYSYEQGFVFPFLSKERIKKLSKDDMHNCSEMVALACKDAGVNLINIKIGSEAIIAPADIGRGKKLKYIGTYWKGKLYSTDEIAMRNVYSEEIQGSQTSLAAKAIVSLFKGWSKRDEFYQKMFAENMYLEKRS